VLHHQHSKWEEQLPEKTLRVLEASRKVKGLQEMALAQATDFLRTGKSML
jgi:hypothetical protein